MSAPHTALAIRALLAIPRGDQMARPGLGARSLIVCTDQSGDR